MRLARGLFLSVLLVAGVLVPAPRPLAGQEASSDDDSGWPEMRLLPALLGGATGLAAGGYVAIGIVTFQARRGHYLYSTEDALGWHATPILIGPSVGFLIGLFDQER